MSAIVIIFVWTGEFVRRQMIRVAAAAKLLVMRSGDLGNVLEFPRPGNLAEKTSAVLDVGLNLLALLGVERPLGGWKANAPRRAAAEDLRRSPHRSRRRFPRVSRALP